MYRSQTLSRYQHPGGNYNPVGLPYDRRHNAGNPRWIQSPYFATGDPESEEFTTLYAPGMFGCLAQFDRGSNNICTYRLVKQNTAISGVVGNVFVWLTRATYTVTTVVTNAGLPAGIGEKIVATAATFIWVAVRGNRPVLVVNAPTVAPDATGAVQAIVSATAGSADGVSVAKVPHHLGAYTSTQDGTSKLASVQLALLDALD
jgi:hypothetical protein